MKKIILAMALMISAWGSFAQADARLYSSKVWTRSRTEVKFNQPDAWINIRDLVKLKNYNELLLELNNVGDFQHLKNMDVLISKFKSDIRFYEDSLANLGSGNVRIDYSVTVDSSDYSDRVEIRFKRYPPDGDAYLKKVGDIAKLKLEQDTINFILQILPEETRGNRVSKTPYTYSIQASFFLNNYTDIYKIGEDKEFLNHTLDTLASTKKEGTMSKPYKFPSTTIYTPYVKSKYSFRQFDGLCKREDIHMPYANQFIQRSDKIMIVLNTGLGLVRNTLTPMAEGGIAWYNMRPAFSTKKFQEAEINTFVGLSATPYFFFDRNVDGNFYVKDNWFVNLEVGGATDFLGLTSSLVTGGIGYLFSQKGDYFKGTTMKAFLNVKLRNGPTISPELIVTGGFKQIFPGITVKLF